MKRTISIFVCLCAVSLSVMAEEIKHVYHDDYPSKFSVTDGSKKGTYNDGTVYTCKGNSIIEGATIGGKIYIVISITKLDSILISPAKAGLTGLEVYYENSNNFSISVSKDCTKWVPIENVGVVSLITGTVQVTSISGNYNYISIKNLNNSKNVYIRKIDYEFSDVVEDTCDNCFPVVFE